MANQTRPTEQELVTKAAASGQVSRAIVTLGTARLGSIPQYRLGDITGPERAGTAGWDRPFSSLHTDRLPGGRAHRGLAGDRPSAGTAPIAHRPSGGCGRAGRAGCSCSSPARSQTGSGGSASAPSRRRPACRRPRSRRRQRESRPAVVSGAGSGASRSEGKR